MELTDLKGALQKHRGLDGRHRRVKSSASLRYDTKQPSSAQQVPLFWLTVRHLTSSFTLLKELSGLKVKYELEHQQQSHMHHTHTHRRALAVPTHFSFLQTAADAQEEIMKEWENKGKEKKETDDRKSVRQEATRKEEMRLNEKRDGRKGWMKGNEKRGEGRQEATKRTRGRGQKRRWGKKRGDKEGSIGTAAGGPAGGDHLQHCLNHI